MMYRGGAPKMGFCLLENPELPNGWTAVNPAYIERYEEGVLQGYKNKVTTLHLPENITVHDLIFFVKGTTQDIENTFNDAVKIGMKTAEMTILGGRDNKKPLSVQLGNTSRIVLIKELLPEEFISPDAGYSTCSLIVFEDNTTRFAIERPGVIAHKVNADSQVPKFPE